MAKPTNQSVLASGNDMTKMMKTTGYDTENIKEACAKYDACALCATTVRSPDRKISTTSTNRSFSEELQAEFLYVYIRDIIMRYLI